MSSASYQVDHYENFPVASILLPRHLRRPVSILYHFARNADDFADEGDLPAAERLRLLGEYRAELDRIAAGQTPLTPLFRDLAGVVAEHELPLQLFHDLLDAFVQDVSKTRYAHFGEVMEYCRRSANPVGRLMLHLFKEAEPRNLALSDGICSALQLINFWQDVAIDYAKGRIYLPQDEMAEYGVSEEALAQQMAAGTADARFKALLMMQIERSRKILRAGSPLGVRLKGRIGLEIRLIVVGGDTILQKLAAGGGDVFRHRPVLGARDWPGMIWRALRKR
ncbi:squalene synthase HpnC [Parachitinimonas caeni]|uniref:Squalene synthase HpnC n=1 Tax=Parachitinimonas caeni TaxID=3031301 RepID=A0ABT7DZP0_9NEIS|nr:squalene synthase HpnC [Parachitinimonas caeni]MDK2125518.1 squalene synthase HpnC [Parachitinimonas caeni]